jgi:hypothetical protein
MKAVVVALIALTTLIPVNSIADDPDAAVTGDRLQQYCSAEDSTSSTAYATTSSKA